MRKREKAILKWCQEHRPDLVDTMKKVIEKNDNAIILITSTAFEAGRQFQFENPKLQPNQPGQYLE